MGIRRAIGSCGLRTAPNGCGFSREQVSPVPVVASVAAIGAVRLGVVFRLIGMVLSSFVGKLEISSLAQKLLADDGPGFPVTYHSRGEPSPWVLATFKKLSSACLDWVCQLGRAALY